MAERIEYPALPAGAPAEEQLQQMYTYLYHMAETLNANLEEVGGMDLTDEERQVMMTILHPNPEGDYQPAFEGAEAESLKSLIIKTAAWVKNELQEYRINLLGEYVADGKFGKYVRNTKMAVDVTPTGITQQFKFSEIIEDLKKYEINAKNYIKTGLLRTEQSIPVYGVAVGKDIVTFSQDGTETYHDENKVAELTADQLTFYSNQVKLASFSGTELIFYAGGVQKVKMDTNGVTILNGNTKLAEFLSTALKFYYNGNLRTTVDTNGITLQRSSTKLAEFLYAGLSFYYRGTMREQMNSDGITFYDGSTKLAELTGTQLTFYYNGTQRAKMDSNGVTISNGSTKLAEFLSTALKFYYNGTLRAQMDSSGVSFYNGSTNLASLTSNALTFYQNGNNAAVFTANGAQFYSAGNLASEITPAHFDIYTENGEKAFRATTGGIGLYQEGALRGIFVDTDISFYSGTKGNEHLCTEIKETGLKFFVNIPPEDPDDPDDHGRPETLAAEYNPDGIYLYQDGTKKMEITHGHIDMYSNSGERTFRASNTGDGVGLYREGARRATFKNDSLNFYTGAKGSEVLQMQLTGTDQTFYNNGTERCKIDTNGMTIKNGNTKFAEFLGTALKFYYNGTLRTQMDTDGIKFYNGSTMLAKFNAGELDFYQNGSLAAKMTATRIGLYYNGTETLYIDSTGVHATVIKSGIVLTEGNNDYVQTDRLWYNNIYLRTGGGGEIEYKTLTNRSTRDEKHNIRPMRDMGETLDALEPVEFVFDDDPDEKNRYGLIYEDTLPVLPDICTKDESRKAISYVDMIPMLLREIQSLRRRVKQLEDERS